MADNDTRELRGRMAENMIRALYVCGEDLGGKAQRIAPLEEGALRASMTVTLIVNGTRYEGSGALASAIAAARAAAMSRRSLEAAVEVAFNTVYAARQHEELDWHHDEGQAKYLEQPFRDNIARYGTVLQKAAAF